MDLNVFEGLRALSANIAVEMPEAPKDGSLYRAVSHGPGKHLRHDFVINRSLN
jgi:phosphate transport system permease protein